MSFVLFCPCLAWIDVAGVKHYLNAIKAKQSASNAPKPLVGVRGPYLCSRPFRRASALQASRLLLSNLTTIEQEMADFFSSFFCRSGAHYPLQINYRTRVLAQHTNASYRIPCTSRRLSTRSHNVGKVGGTIRYDTRCYFNVRTKADISQLNLPHGTDN